MNDYLRSQWFELSFLDHLVGLCTMLLLGGINVDSQGSDPDPHL